MSKRSKKFSRSCHPGILHTYKELAPGWRDKDCPESHDDPIYIHGPMGSITVHDALATQIIGGDVDLSGLPYPGVDIHMDVTGAPHSALIIPFETVDSAHSSGRVFHFGWMVHGKVVVLALDVGAIDQQAMGVRSMLNPDTMAVERGEVSLSDGCRATLDTLSIMRGRLPEQHRHVVDTHLGVAVGKLRRRLERAKDDLVAYKEALRIAENLLPDSVVGSDADKP